MSTSPKRSLYTHAILIKRPAGFSFAQVDRLSLKFISKCQKPRTATCANQSKCLMYVQYKEGLWEFVVKSQEAMGLATFPTNLFFSHPHPRTCLLILERRREALIYCLSYAPQLETEPGTEPQLFSLPDDAPSNWATLTRVLLTFLCFTSKAPSGPNTGQVLYNFPESSSGMEPFIERRNTQAQKTSWKEHSFGTGQRLDKMSLGSNNKAYVF